MSDRYVIYIDLRAFAILGASAIYLSWMRCTRWLCVTILPKVVILLSREVACRPLRSYSKSIIVLGYSSFECINMPIHHVDFASDRSQYICTLHMIITAGMCCIHDESILDLVLKAVFYLPPAIIPGKYGGSSESYLIHISWFKITANE